MVPGLGRAAGPALVAGAYNPLQRAGSQTLLDG